MEHGKYDSSVDLHCPTCGGTQFKYDEHGETAPMECLGCGLSIDRSELIAANSENIEAHVDQIAKEATADLMRQIQGALRGNKFFKLK